MNRVTIMGRLTANPELKTTQSGISVTSFTVAVNRKFKDASGNFTADFIDCVAWRQTAEFITRFFSKGNMIALEGTLQTRMWEDKNGSKRKTTEVVVDGAYFTGSKNEGNNSSQDYYNAPAGNSAPNFDDIAADDYEIVTNDDDLPF